ncbi:hypothetical protein J7M07_07445 [bacterium]|nr:hypothetical protein [bacterium]
MSVFVLTLMAFFLKKEDVAHTPVSIGVCVFDSSRVDFTFRSFGAWIRKNSGGEINWKYFKDYRERESCDLYMLTSVQVAKSLNPDTACLFLTAEATADGKYPEGVLFMRKEAVFKGEPIGFLSSESAACFVSPILALKDSIKSFGIEEANIEFLGCNSCLRQLFFGVLFGKYIAAGMDMERFSLLMSTEMVRGNELKIVARGKRAPEILLVASKSIDKRKLESLRKIFTGKFNQMPKLLKRDLFELGIAGFSSSEERELEMVREMLSLYDERILRYHP